MRGRATRWWQLLAVGSIAVLSVPSVPSASARQGHVVWRGPVFAAPKEQYATGYPPDQLLWMAIGFPENARPKPALWNHAVPPDPGNGLGRAEAAYAAGTVFEQMRSARAVDAFYLAAENAWPHVPPSPRGAGPGSKRAWNIYHSAIARLLTNAVRHGRWDPQQGIRVASAAGVVQIRPAYRGFSHPSSMFQKFELVGDYAAPQLKRRFAWPGIGVPLVVLPPRPTEGVRVTVAGWAFAATALLFPPDADRPSGTTVGGAEGAPAVRQASLLFLDPRRKTRVGFGDYRPALARDVSAPLAWVVKNRKLKRVHTRKRFPGADGLSRGTLELLEPYMRGKIPVILVHGYRGNAVGWANVINELQARTELERRYQFWLYEYDSTDTFLLSAANLRNALFEVTAKLDPRGYDPALSQITLIGFSMGGLVSKLQVTSSGNRLWEATARRPFQDLQLDGETRERLSRVFFFEPMPSVRQVVFVGTPHRGSPYAADLILRWASSYAADHETRARFRKIVRDNPQTFRRQFVKRLPTSLDLLSPHDPLLRTIEKLPVSPHVRLHTIIGYGCEMPGYGTSDGVVPVVSARHPGVASECYVRSTHSELLYQQKTIDRLVQILDPEASKRLRPPP